jgi:hypothetical protein
MILITMATGRSPWRSAVYSDESFLAYLHDPDYLHTMLPLSKSAATLLRRIFVLDPQARISIADLRVEILALDTFYKTKAELKRSSRGVRRIAESYLKKKLDAAVSQPDYNSEEDDALTEIQFDTPSPKRVVLKAAPRGRPLPKPPVVAPSFSNPPSMLTAGGSTLAVPSSASFNGPITPETYAVGDSNIADVVDPLELGLPRTDGLVYDFRKFPSAKKANAEKKERSPNFLRQAMQKLRLGQ